MDVYDINDDNPHKRLLKAIDKLDDNTSVHIDMKAGTITVDVIARYPELAVLLNRRLLDLVNDFNLRRRQSQAGAERRFVETRMQAAQRELTQAEDDMARFLERNRLVDLDDGRARLDQCAHLGMEDGNECPGSIHAITVDRSGS